MNYKERIDAVYIKAELVDFILECSKYDLLVNEAPFLQGNRWADLLAVQGNNLIGFEIKSERDNLRNLSAQIADYNRVFNKTYIVIDEKFIKSPEIKSLHRYNGIIVRTKNKLIMVREAKYKKRLDKFALCCFLWKKDCDRYLRKEFTDINKQREMLANKYTISKLIELSIESLKNRYIKSYNLFLHDRGEYTTIEDITTITRIDKPLYLCGRCIEPS